MSTPEEIAEVYNRDIEEKSHKVFLKSGYFHFLDGFAGMTISNIFTPREWYSLQNIAKTDTREGLMTYTNAPKRKKVGRRAV